MPIQPIDAFFVDRAAEHLAVAGIGTFVVWLGYRLFLDMPLRREGETKITLPGGVSILLSRVGPGIFFALFGTAMIGYTATRQVSYQEAVSLAGQTRNVNGAFAGSAPAGTSAPAALPQTALPAERVVQALAGMAKEIAAAPITQVQIQRDNALREARARVMLQSWDPAWGSAEAFAAWVFDRAGQGPPPQGAERAAAIYRGAP